jgi:spore coat polysaccharide biosynthesis protein SpsF (cytidylyltransferase family)
MKYTRELQTTSIKRVAIGIQARSTSVRFPEKVLADICGKPMLEWVIDAARESSAYVSRPNTSSLIDCSVFVLIPTGDKIGSLFFNKAQMVEGPEHDVLSRYKRLLDLTKADYIVRITADCPLIPPPVISNAVITAVSKDLDYVSNVDERLRLAYDGMDCEVISARLMNYMAANAVSKDEREHVTKFARSEKMPKEFRVLPIVGYVDLSGLKLSVDTIEDLDAVRAQKAKILNALRIAKEISGENTVRRF